MKESVKFFLLQSVFLMTLFLVIPGGLLVLWMYAAGTPDTVTYEPIMKLESPDGRWVVTMRDRRHEYGLFPIVTFVTEVWLHRADGAGDPVKLVASFTDLREGLRPELRWIAADRLCVATPRIDNMAVHSGEINGVTVDMHVLSWNQKPPLPQIHLDAACRSTNPE